MEIENKNVGNKKNPKEELGNKRVVLSDEQLQEAAGGKLIITPKSCSRYFEGCTAKGYSKEECAPRCGY